MQARRALQPVVVTTRSRPITSRVIRVFSTAASLRLQTSGPAPKPLLENTRALVAYWKARGVDPTPDLVTTSGSGLDPDITPQDAIAEIPMVSRATGISPRALRNLINQQTTGMQLGFLGSPYVNVLQLNEALVKLEG